MSLSRKFKNLIGRIINRGKKSDFSKIENRLSGLMKVVDYPRQKLKTPNEEMDLARLKISWVIPKFKPGDGGHMTIFRIAHYLEKFGHEISLYIQNPRVHDSSSKAKETINQHFQPFNGAIELFTDTLPNAVGDILIATDRFTCYPVNAMTGFRKKFYFVQDYETLFYPMGSEALLTDATYGFEFDCLCAGEWLHQLMETKFDRWSISWPLAYDKSVYGVNDRVTRESSRIAFYARLATPRRAVELGFMALEILRQRGVSFEVDFFGAGLGKMDLGYGYVDHGVLNAESLAALYQKSTIGLVFSTTNHSLINKEMMACGLPVVDLNVDSVKANFPEDTVAFAYPTPDGIANTIQALLKDRSRQNRFCNCGFVFCQAV